MALREEGVFDGATDEIGRGHLSKTSEPSDFFIRSDTRVLALPFVLELWPGHTVTLASPPIIPFRIHHRYSGSQHSDLKG